MNRKVKIKVRFVKESALVLRSKLRPLEGKRFLNNTALVLTVRKILVAPAGGIFLPTFLSDPDLLKESTLDKYPDKEFAVLLLVDSSDFDSRIYTLEEFESEIGLSTSILEMITGLSV